MATPFVQGRLRGEQLAVAIETECAHCGERIQITVDSEMHYQVHTRGAKPLIFEPDIDWEGFTEPNILHAY